MLSVHSIPEWSEWGYQIAYRCAVTGAVIREALTGAPHCAPLYALSYYCLPLSAFQISIMMKKVLGCSSKIRQLYILLPFLSFSFLTTCLFFSVCHFLSTHCFSCVHVSQVCLLVSPLFMLYITSGSPFSLLFPVSLKVNYKGFHVRLNWASGRADTLYRGEPTIHRPFD